MYRRKKKTWTYTFAVLHLQAGSLPARPLGEDRLRVCTEEVMIWQLFCHKRVICASSAFVVFAKDAFFDEVFNIV